MSFFVWLLFSCSYLIFFFYMIRRPPRSTLFPTRRSSDLRCRPRLAPALALAHPPRGNLDRRRPVRTRLRSEEHTSELQSPDHLVCRLLLEKKKQRLQHRRCISRQRSHSAYPPRSATVLPL